ncbi:MAG TPA: DUF255 domain-containing protein [Terriglobia bacterium]|nr:DUF255 domain-containing protein [Terriglobia bacterium]
MRPWTAGIAILCMGFLFGPRAEAQSNHLRNSTSPYLQRASVQPVDWYPWSPEAWARARQLDRPVLIDLGAVWCPWCAQMDRESYTQAETAAFINAHFVAIKIDYDADPKLAASLERAQAFLNLPSGLPVTAFATPSGKLYFGGSYFPAQASHAKPAFFDAMRQALALYRDHRADQEREGFDLKPGGR